jgi:ATP-binding cassette subfamily A (ABC1) protein 3
MSFGASVIPLTYCYSFAFSNHANAQVDYHCCLTS